MAITEERPLMISEVYKLIKDSDKGEEIKIFLVVIPIIAVTSFSMIAYDAWGEYDELMFDLVYSNLFIIGISIAPKIAIIEAILVACSSFL